MKNGMFEGTWKSYYENGQIKVDGLYKRNLEEGLFRWYDEEGRLKEEVFREDVFQGNPSEIDGHIIRID